MNNRTIVLASFVSIAWLVACGGDQPANHASVDAGAVDSGDSPAGQGGSGGAAGGGDTAGTIADDAGAGGAGAGGTNADGGTGAAGAGAAGAEAGSGGSAGSTVSYAVGGHVSGLLGTGLVLRNGDTQDLTIAHDGTFEFSELVAGTSYAVAVKTQPSKPSQTCTVAGGSGTVGTSDVTDIDVACSTNKYSLGGSVAGLTGTLYLSNPGAFLAVAPGSATFTFASSLESGAAYDVSIGLQPANQTCRVSQGSGHVASGDVNTVAITCVTNNLLEVEPLFNSAIVRWNDTGASDYTLRLTTASSCDPLSAVCPGAAEFAHVHSPLSLPNLTNGTAYYLTLSATYADDFSVNAKAGVRPNTPVFDGDVRALATIGGTTYVAGDFQRLSVYSGGATPVDSTTGFPSVLPNFPIIDGEVYAVHAAADGGYYVAGLFSRVGAGARSNLAHIKADGTLDTAWNPSPNGAVRALAGGGTSLYVAGDFTTLGGENRAGFGVLDSAGNVTSDPSPNGRVAGFVTVPDGPGSATIVGGSFTAIGAQSIAYLARLDSNGHFSAWGPALDGPVMALASTSLRSYFTIYVGGYFQNVGGQPHRHLAMIAGDGTVQSWSPDPDQWVDNMALATDVGGRSPTLYVAGGFTTIDGASRAGLAAIVTGGPTAGVTTWNPTPEPAASVRTILLSGDVLYLGGSFSSIGGVARNAAAAVPLDGIGTPTSWNPNPDGPINSLAAVAGAVVLGGEYTGVGGVNRAHLAAFQSGQVTSWNPSANDAVDALAVSGTTLYAGGAFTQLGGAARSRIGAIDSNGALNPWDPGADDAVLALATSGTTVYAGGDFANVGGAARAHIAALDASGTAAAWNPGLNGAVRALLSDGATVYAGGDFTQIGGATTRNRVVAIDSTSGLPTVWNPNADGSVRTLALFEGQVVAGGAFANIGGAARARLAALDAAAGGATTWAPAPDAPVRALAVDGNSLYVGGEFITVTGASRNRLAVYDNTFGLLADYYPNIDGAVNALSITANAVQVAGELTHIDNVFTGRFASLPKPE